MQVTATRQPGSVVELLIEVPVDQVSQAVETAYARLAPRVKVAGFRPGHAPREVIERQIGWPTLREQALELLVPEVVSQAVVEQQLAVIDTPRVDIHNFERSEPAVIHAHVTVKPEVKLADYSAIKAPLVPEIVVPEQVDQSLEEIRGAFGELVPVTDRAVRQGDQIVADIQMYKDGQPVDSLGADQQLDVEPEGLIPGLGDGLIGAAAGETRDIPVTLPADHRRTELAGQPVTFQVAVKEIKERRLPALDDELARMAQAGDTLAELRQQVEERLRVAAERDAIYRQQKAALDQLIAGSTYELPEVMVEDEIDREIRNSAVHLGHQGIDFDKLVEFGGLDVEKLRNESRPGAEERVRQELVLDALAEAVGLSPTDAHVEAEAGRTLEGSPDEQRLTSSERVREYIRERMRLQWALLWLAASARGETWEAPAPDAGEAAEDAQVFAANEIVQEPEPVTDEQGMTEI